MNDAEKRLAAELAAIGCEKVSPDNPLRVAISCSSFADLLVAVEKYLDEFDKIIADIIEDPTNPGWGARMAEINNELSMYATIARQKLGT